MSTVQTVSAIRVVHIKENYPDAIYIGRKMPGLAASPLANPYKFKKHGFKALELYRDYLRPRLRVDTLQRREIYKLIDKFINGEQIILACWCKTADKPDAPCHGDVIKEEIEYQLKRNLMGTKRELQIRIFQRDGYKCSYCGVDLSKPDAKPTLDHVIPLAKGGGWYADNLVTACEGCNFLKGDMSAEEFKELYFSKREK